MNSTEAYEALREYDAETNAHAVQRGVDRIALAQTYNLAREAEENHQPPKVKPDADKPLKNVD